MMTMMASKRFIRSFAQLRKPRPIILSTTSMIKIATMQCSATPSKLLSSLDCYVE